MGVVCFALGMYQWFEYSRKVILVSSGLLVLLVNLHELLVCLRDKAYMQV